MQVISNKFSFVGKLPEMRVAPAQMSEHIWWYYQLTKYQDQNFTSPDIKESVLLIQAYDVITFMSKVNQQKTKQSGYAS